MTSCLLQRCHYRFQRVVPLQAGGRLRCRLLSSSASPRHHRQRLSRNTAAASSAALRRRAVEICDAPASIGTILDGPHDVSSTATIPGAAIRNVGSTRRVFLLKPFLSADELEGLAYRMRTLSKNDSLSSVLVATSNEDDAENNCLPSSALQVERVDDEDGSVNNDFFDPESHTYHIAGGYDPITLTSHNYDKTLDGLRQLALATRGDVSSTCIPVITVPHGMIEDGGYALCLSSYVIATNQSSLRLKYATRGLSFDPIGYSYILPRVGRDNNQVSKEYAESISVLMSLLGYEANASDMVETGLATHYMDQCDSGLLATFERALGQSKPYNQQEFIRKPKTFEGDAPSMNDHNAQFRNQIVANTVHIFTDYHAYYDDMWSTSDFPDDDLDIGFEAYKDCNPTPWHADRSSSLINIAATFDEIFSSKNGTKTVLDIYRGLEEVANRQTADVEEQEGIDIAKQFVQRMQESSPLSLCLMHKLLQLGAATDQSSSLEQCMKRERQVQSKMFMMEDYQNWVKHAKKVSSSAENQTNNVTLTIPPFMDWKYKKIEDVPNDLVEELTSLSKD